MRKTRGGWGETFFPPPPPPFPKSRASSFRSARFITSSLYYLRAWHRLKKSSTVKPDFFKQKPNPPPPPHKKKKQKTRKNSWLWRIQSSTLIKSIFRGSTIGLAGCGIWLFFVVILGMRAENRSGMREF